MMKQNFMVFLFATRTNALCYRTKLLSSFNANDYIAMKIMLVNNLLSISRSFHFADDFMAHNVNDLRATNRQHYIAITVR